MARFIDEVASAIPPVRELLDRHLATYKALLPHVFFIDVSTHANMRRRDPRTAALEAESYHSAMLLAS